MVGSISIGPNPSLSLSDEWSYTLFRGIDWRPSSYNHEIRADGGFWNMSFEVLGDRDFLLFLFENGLMMRSRSYEETGDLAFEGYIHEMTIRTGFEEHTVSMDNIANYAFTIYKTGSLQGVSSQVKDYNAEDTSQVIAHTDATLAMTRGTAISDLDSIARFGRWERILDGGEMPLATADLVAQKIVDQKAWPWVPSREVVFGSGVSRLSLSVTVHGFIRYLGRRQHRNNSSGTTVAIGTKVAALSVDYPEFILSTEVEANASLVSDHDLSRRPVLEVLRGLAALGDSSNNRWVFGMEENQRFYFREAASSLAADVAYIGEVRDRGPQLLYQGTTPIPLSLVWPDNYYKSGGSRPWVADTPANLIDDYNAHYVESVLYTEPAQLQLRGEKDATLDILLARVARGGFSKV